MTSLKSIPPIAVVQAVARNGAQHQNSNAQNMRHAFAIRGQGLPVRDTEREAEVGKRALRALFCEVEKKHRQLRFEIKESLNQIFVSVIDRETGELMHQVSGEAAMETAEHLKAIGSDEVKAGIFLSSRI